MQLHNDSVGISDILDYRECAQRMAWKQRRFMDIPERFKIFEGQKDEPPEATNWTNAYGSAVHDVIAMVEGNRALSDDEAIDACWANWQHYLEPDDIDRLRHDLETFHTRTETGYRLIGAEIEMRTPLLVWEGRTIYFRGKVDALYQHIQNPGIFLSRDYKSSRWPKTQEEIQKDPQQWSYNWLIHENYPEAETLVQIYDQLRHGDEPIRKTPEQRRQIREWLVKQVTALLQDEYMKPTQNDWCAYCPLVMDCSVTHLSGDYWKNRIGALSTEKKVGRKIQVTLTDEHAGLEIYTDLLPKMKISLKVMERFIAAVEETLKEMDQETRESFGYGLTKPRSKDEFNADALRRVREMMGDDFFQVAKITKSAVEGFYGKDAPEAEQIFALATKKETNPSLKAKS